MAINTKNDGDRGYVAFYNGERVEIYAPTMYIAKCRAVEHFKVPTRKIGLVGIMLAEREDGSEVIHVAT